MRLALIGPELEENLSLRYLMASAEAAGHEVRIFDFHRPGQIAEVARAITTWRPEATGLSMIFTARSREFAALASALRAAGYAGHITTGGHFASFNASQLLHDVAAFDSIVHGEGEEAVVELLEQLGGQRRDLSAVDGLTWRAADGALVENRRRKNAPELDARPWPTRPQHFQSYLGFPIANLLSGRGCYAHCNFCSITAWHKDNGGMRFRQRSVECVADEIAHLYLERGARIFNFQDDNFFLPTAAANLERFTALQRALEARGVGHMGLQAKARPDSIDEAVIHKLQEMGLFRLFLGVETDAVVGLETLGRGIMREQNHAALDILRRRKVHTCFNLLMFDPESQVEAIAQNVAFMRRQEYFPLNFCRTEVYSGTPLERRLRAEGRLEGDYFGYWYTIADAQAELAYQLFRRVFTPRNFDAGGMHHESMKVDYKYHILAHFHAQAQSGGLERRVKASIARLNQNSADLMDAICAYVTSNGAANEGRQHALVAQLSARREAFDAEIAQVYAGLSFELETLAATARQVPRQPHHSWRNAAASAAAALLLVAPGCSSPQTHMCEMAPPPNEDAYGPRLESESAEAQAEAERQMAAHSAALAARHGLHGRAFSVVLEVGPNGQVTPMQFWTNPVFSPVAEAELGAFIGSWRFPWAAPGSSLHLQLTFPAAEAATGPVADDWTNPQDARWLEGADANRVLQETWTRLDAEGQFLLVDGRSEHVFEFVLELDDEGRVVRLSLSARNGLTSEQQQALERVVSAWTFDGIAHGGRAQFSFLFPKPDPAKVEPEIETHMCEMAPRPIEPAPGSPTLLEER